MRIGLLGARRFAKRTLIEPAKACADIEVAAVAGTEAEHADRFARAHGIPTAYRDPRELLADEELDAVYLAAPELESLREAVTAGKHVLYEPLSLERSEGIAELDKAAAEAGTLLRESKPHRHHPLLWRATEVLESGELGEVHKIVVTLGRAYPWHSGVLALDLARMLAGTEPEPVSARQRPNGALRARMRLSEPDVSVRARCSALTLKAVTKVYASSGEIRVLNPIAPHLGHQLSVRIGGNRVVEHFPRRPAYCYQLEDFARAATGRVLTTSRRDSPGADAGTPSL